jgi:hypothetical protein
MIEALTVDYDRVQSSSATIDGSRIVFALGAGGGSTNISLPVSEVARLIAAIATGANMAKQAQGRNCPSLAFQARRLKVRLDDSGSLFAIALVGGTELLFRADRQVFLKFVSDCAKMMQYRSTPSREPLQ